MIGLKYKNLRLNQKILIPLIIIYLVIIGIHLVFWAFLKSHIQLILDEIARETHYFQALQQEGVEPKELEYLCTSSLLSLLPINVQYIESNLAILRDFLIRTQLLIFIDLLIIGILFIITSKLLKREISIPVVKISTTAGRVAEGEVVPFSENFSNDEIGALSKNLNIMMEKLKNTYTNLQREISEKEAALYRSQELEKRKDDFISMASHELKTPVTSLKVYTQILAKYAEQKEDIYEQKYLRKMSSQIDRLSFLVTELLDATNITIGMLTLKKEKLNMGDLLSEICDNLRQSISTHAIELHIQKCKPVYGDKERLGQVFVNLIMNAIKYSPNKGKVIVSVYCKRQGIYVSVRDYGIGIDERYKAKIFEKFYRVYDKNVNTFPGLGMGLYLSKVIMLKHGGEIWVNSVVGKGSTFFVYIPLKGEILHEKRTKN